MVCRDDTPCFIGRNFDIGGLAPYTQRVGRMGHRTCKLNRARERLRLAMVCFSPLPHRDHVEISWSTPAIQLKRLSPVDKGPNAWSGTCSTPVMLRLRSLIGGLVAVSLVACNTASDRSPPPTAQAQRSGPPPIDADDPSTCAPCHQHIVAEWSESMHAHATADHDPIFAGMVELRTQKEGEDIREQCASCHAPTRPKSTTQAPGVSCSACHNLVNVDLNHRGAKALEYASDKRMVGANHLPAQASPVHPTGSAPAWMTDGQTLCLACHGQLQNASDVPMCTTGLETAAHPQPRRCVDCHMQDTPTPGGTAGAAHHADHRFVSVHRAWTHDDTSSLALAVDLSGQLDGETLSVTLVNRTGHAFPTGFPGRVMTMKLVGSDASGTAIWSNGSNNLMAESPESVFNQVFVDDAGQPTLPPFAATRSRDNRLKPGESRSIQFTIPKNVESVHATLAFHLVPKPAIGPLGLKGHDWTTPRPFASKTWRRGE